MRNHRGFTLIEMLVVMGIFSILIGMLTISFTASQKKARDAQRKSDLRQLSSILEVYRGDQVPPAYPSPAASSFSSCAPAVAPTQMQAYAKTLPCKDPGTTSANNYYYDSDGTTYTIGACLEAPNSSETTLCSSINAALTTYCSTLGATKCYKVIEAK